MRNRLTERDLSRIVRRVINEREDDTSMETEDPNTEEKQKYYHRLPSTFRHDYLNDNGYIKEKYAVQFEELHNYFSDKFGGSINERDMILECLVLASRKTYSPNILEEYLFTQLKIKAIADTNRSGF